MALSNPNEDKLEVIVGDDQPDVDYSQFVVEAVLYPVLGPALKCLAREIRANPELVAALIEKHVRTQSGKEENSGKWFKALAA